MLHRNRHQQPSSSTPGPSQSVVGTEPLWGDRDLPLFLNAPTQQSTSIFCAHQLPLSTARREAPELAPASARVTAGPSWASVQPRCSVLCSVRPRLDLGSTCHVPALTPVARTSTRATTADGGDDQPQRRVVSDWRRRRQSGLSRAVARTHTTCGGQIGGGGGR